MAQSTEQTIDVKMGDSAQTGPESNADEAVPKTEVKPSKIPCEILYNKLKDLGVDFYAGVPDSLLKDFCAYVTDNCSSEKHIICANEGTAVATATGHHLACGSLPVVYLQNSGFGNIINPLLSLASPEVYRIPMLLLIGWRGEPGVKDEPQHQVMGRLQERLLQACEVPYAVLPTQYADGSDLEGELNGVLKNAVDTAKRTQGPFALLVKKNTFESYKLSAKTKDSMQLVGNELGPNHPSKSDALSRESAMELLITANADAGDHISHGFLSGKPVVSTTGVLSRELYELREKLGFPIGSDFLCVGSMGHASAIAHGIACAPVSNNSAAPVVCLDGDGGALMHLGQMAINGCMPNKLEKTDNDSAQLHLSNSLKRPFIHILINNGLHESVGGQPTTGLSVDFCEIAKGCQYTWVRQALTKEEIVEAVKEIETKAAEAMDPEAEGNIKGARTFFLEILVKPGVKPNLGRPKNTPEENKLAFVKTHFSA